MSNIKVDVDEYVVEDEELTEQQAKDEANAAIEDMFDPDRSPPKNPTVLRIRGSKKNC